MHHWNPTDGHSDHVRINVEQSFHIETLPLKIAVSRKGTSNIAGADHDEVVFLVKTQDLADLIAQVADVVSVALLPETAKIVQVLSDL